MELSKSRYDEMMRMIRAFADAETSNESLRIFNAQRRARLLIQRLKRNGTE